jgi:CO/xanthine dehydrogenase Mo-binding subunit
VRAAAAADRTGRARRRAAASVAFGLVATRRGCARPADTRAPAASAAHTRTRQRLEVEDGLLQRGQDVGGKQPRMQRDHALGTDTTPPRCSPSRCWLRPVPTPGAFNPIFVGLALLAAFVVVAVDARGRPVLASVAYSLSACGPAFPPSSARATGRPIAPQPMTPTCLIFSSMHMVSRPCETTRASLASARGSSTTIGSERAGLGYD